MRLRHISFTLAALLAAPVGALAQADQAAPAAPAPAEQTPPAQAPAAQAPAAQPAASQAKAPDYMEIFFAPGSSAIREDDMPTLEHAARLYRDGKPIVMVVSGGTDATGSPDLNLRLSVARANAVVRELVERGIPIERFQVVGKGITDPAVPDENGKPEPRNRRAVITWR